MGFQAAKGELLEGILQYYGTQVEWSASELPAEPDEAGARGKVWRFLLCFYCVETRKCWIYGGLMESNGIWVCLKMLCTHQNPNGFADHEIPFLNG